MSVVEVPGGVWIERGSNPGDITAALGFLLESPGFTGQLLCIDGGQHLAWKTADIDTEL